MTTLSLHLLARAPVPGRVKTRLIPTLGEEGASRLQRALLEQTLALPPLAFEQRFLWLDGDADRPLQRLAEGQDWVVVEQPAGDLGERMRRIAALGLAEHDGVVLIGNDCPALDGNYLQQACAALEEHRAVLGPAEDGGYVLLGLRSLDHCLFEDMPWGGDQVLARTCECLQRLAWPHLLLPTLWDVDRPQDLARLAELDQRWRNLVH